MDQSLISSGPKLITTVSSNAWFCQVVQVSSVLTFPLGINNQSIVTVESRCDGRFPTVSSYSPALTWRSTVYSL